MPMHDWTRVPAGTYHAFHNSWITFLQATLNDGLLPPSYYALGDQRMGEFAPDVLALQTESGNGHEPDWLTDGDSATMVAVATAPPRVRFSSQVDADAEFYAQRRRTLAIRHVSGDRVVALIEILSPGNKNGHQPLDDLVEKVVASLQDGIHVLVIDPFPPTRNDPEGIHGVIWSRVSGQDYDAPDDLPLTLASYAVRNPLTAYVEPIRVGSLLTDMPLFLTPTHYVPVPLEATYGRAWSSVPRRWQAVIESEPV